MSSPPIKQPTPPALPVEQKRGSKRAAPASISPTRSKDEKEEEIVILDSTPSPVAPTAKKAKTSTTAAASTTGTSKGNPTQTGNGSVEGTVASKKDGKTAASAASGGVKKTIFMPGFGAKPNTPTTIPAKLAETLSVPLPSTSTSTADGKAAAAAATATLKRDFVDALPADLKELLQMEIETMGDDWFCALRGEFVKPYFRELKKFVIAEQKSKKVFPPGTANHVPPGLPLPNSLSSSSFTASNDPGLSRVYLSGVVIAEDVYSWTRLCPLSGIRVIVIGQFFLTRDSNGARSISCQSSFLCHEIAFERTADLWLCFAVLQDDGQAHGLAFSVRKGIRTPPSLRNIYKELGEELEAFKAPSHGRSRHLTSWARQGVLLLNTCLTVRAHEAASHSKKGWETFTTAVLKTIIDRLAPTGSEEGAQGVVFLAWGAPAGKLCIGISELMAVLPPPRFAEIAPRLAISTSVPFSSE
ncbi:hypothetical protein QFC21_000797 [Naganishia friedmannii]|uniref:Uncharacterized protein n=1 Tax=Naganishia friedmannii TaxID=89922 RepID=A0ACC2W6S4_9TREE|nr:hypothetical protein QFC21_000797 [Naganishia friedmannii]